jgi:hypothetical protein
MLSVDFFKKAMLSQVVESSWCPSMDEWIKSGIHGILLSHKEE